MIKPFEYYLQENLVRKTLPNRSMARSFITKAEVRIRLMAADEFTSNESSVIFEEIYEALREACQALMEMKGYKPYSHEALISYLKEYKLLSESDVSILDDYRILRNDSVYRAEVVSIEKTKEAISFAKKIIPMIRKRFQEINEQ